VIVAVRQGAGRVKHGELRRLCGRAARARLEELGVRIFGRLRLDFYDPWGNLVQVVDYRDVQFTKAHAVLRAQGLKGLKKSERAREELRAKGISTR
jgi:hypothetical protein